MSASRLSIFLSFTLALSTVSAQQTIIVQPAETLWTLAQRHGTTVADLMAANGLETDLLSVGMTLILPEDAQVRLLVEPSPAVAHEAAAAVVAAAAPAPSAVVAGSAAALASETVAPEESATRPVIEVSSAVVVTPVPTYTVQPGDNLHQIAQAHNLTLEQLMGINGLRSVTINPGQILKVAGQSDGPLTIIIQPGESLSTIANRYDLAPRQLAAANRIELHTVLNPGHPLIIPDASFFVAEESAEPVPDIGGAVGPTITVQPGDTLWNLARIHHTTVDALRDLNALDSDSLTAGQTLRLLPDMGAVPAPSTPVAAAVLSSTDMIWPASGLITSYFGWRSLRIGGTNMHYGLDIDGITGDPIYSATAGVVTFSGWRGGYGNLVIVEAGGTEYYYAHASALVASVGQIVQPGDLLARIGATGNVTGSHLHFEIRVNGTPVDPLPILEARAGQR